jgi:hypothetical protein
VEFTEAGTGHKINPSSAGEKEGVLVGPKLLILFSILF